MRAVAIAALLFACGRSEAVPLAPGGAAPGSAVRIDAAASAGASGTARGAGQRLADGIVPLAYDLTLELDPAADSFVGRVAITIAVHAPETNQLWLHAVDLDISSAVLRSRGRDEPVAMLPGGRGTQLRGFGLPRSVDGETVVLALEYRGRVSNLGGGGASEEGLFRERAGDRWYLYSQAESIFARRFVPCFDEPRWKPAWRVTAIVPPDQIALSNAPAAQERVRPDGRREVRFAEVRALPSYLLAVAVGPFELVDAGRIGRARVPTRFAVPRGDRVRVAPALRVLPALIDGMERYLDAPLPLDKLDIVAVPRLFGAMEHPGLITFDAAVLFGGPELVTVAAHELAHQWFGNSVTPAWWDELWLAEAFATWLGDRVAGTLAGQSSAALAHHVRVRAYAADDARDAKPLVHPVAMNDDIEPAFDAIAYDKGAAVLAMFESFVGERVFQMAVRSYTVAHAGASVTSMAFIDALSRAASPAVGAALASNLHHTGTPVVELVLRCDAAPAIVASARGGVTVPVCVRVPPGTGSTTRLCWLVGARSEQRLASCPPWVVGNAEGRGYYRTVWRGGVAPAPLFALTPEERLARGDDIAGAVRHGELAVADAKIELAALAAIHSADGELAALAIARAIDPHVAGASQPAWHAWLVERFATRLTRAVLAGPHAPVDEAVLVELAELVSDALDPATRAALRAAVAATTPSR